MARRSSVAAWAWDHPFLVAGVFLLLEALLPVRFQPSAWVARGLIRAYQATLSGHLPGQCKFTPTCSHYGLGCVRKYGTLRGGILTTWRLVRCSPLTRGGVDPIP
ncbi:MAG: membrane protein insertion efficiency factor YidD [Acidobacteria bacterium]|nr:membrane protein insertion efficiency factor YidD [Acidobacteriota bacterium]